MIGKLPLKHLFPNQDMVARRARTKCRLENVPVQPNARIRTRTNRWYEHACNIQTELSRVPHFRSCRVNRTSLRRKSKRRLVQNEMTCVGTVFQKDFRVGVWMRNQYRPRCPGAILSARTKLSLCSVEEGCLTVVNEHHDTHSSMRTPAHEEGVCLGITAML